MGHPCMPEPARTKKPLMRRRRLETSAAGYSKTFVRRPKVKTVSVVLLKYLYRKEMHLHEHKEGDLPIVIVYTLIAVLGFS